MSYDSLTNKKDGVAAAAEDNKEPIGTDPDAATDAAEYRQNIDPAGIKGHAPSPGQGAGVSVEPLKRGDPRFA